jgi:hypothetical protein
VEASNQQSVALGQMSFTNALQTVWPGNRNLYWLSRDALTVQTGVNDSFYFLYDTGTTGTGHIVTLTEGVYTRQTFAAEIDRAINTEVYAQILWHSDTQTFSINMRVGERMYIPTAADLASSTWKAQQLGRPDVHPGSTYDYNRYLTAPDGYLNSFVVTNSLPTVYRTSCRVAQLALGYYDGVGFASAVIVAIQTVFSQATASYVEPNLTIDTGVANREFFFPLADQLRDPAWKAANWFGAAYDIYNPQSVNSALNAPTSFAKVTTTAAIDLTTVRELYLHSNLCSGSIACRPREPWTSSRASASTCPTGTCRCTGPWARSTASKSRLAQSNLRNIRMTLKDAYGTVIPMSHFITYELSLVDTPM